MAGFASDEPTVTITLRGGLADRHRLPLNTVLKFLTEFRTTFTAVGREIHASRGGIGELDFGLEILGTTAGDVATKGSLRLRLAITQNAEIGTLTANRVLATLSELNRPTLPTRKPPQSESVIGARVVAGLERLAFINTSVKAEAAFKINRPVDKGVILKRAVLGGVAIMRMKELDIQPVFVEHEMCLYGKLYQLKDNSVEFAEDRTGFWGELRMDNGDRWRVKFSSELSTKASVMFRKQVRIEGDASYFQHRTPKLVAHGIELDDVRDYEKAFDELWGLDKELFSGVPFSEILDSRYGSN